MYSDLFEKKCRVCLSNNVDDLLSIFSLNENVKNSLTNAELIMACSSVQITKNDGFPQNICRVCNDKLSKSYEFKLLCENSDKILRRVKQEEIDINQEYCDENSSIYETNHVKPVSDVAKKKNNSTSTYTCKLCSKVYKYHSLFSQHLSSCLKHKTTKNELNDRIINIQNENLVKKTRACPNCHKNFNTKEDLKIHVAEELKLIKTREVQFKESNTVKLIAAKSTENKINVLLKDKKEKQFNQKPLLRCLVCDKNFENILAHYTEVHKTKKCPHCNKEFAKFNHFLRHMKSDCKNNFHDKETELKEPIEENVKNIRKSSKHLCPYCGHFFTDSNNLKTHMRIHTGEKPYECEFCDRSFAQWSSLRSHRVVHTGERNYACEICGKAFARSFALRMHIKSHSDEQDYSCDICGKKFKHSRSAKEHMVIHTGDKNYSCEHCGKAFGFKKNLVVHRRTHTGDKPYVCEICSQRFTQRHCLQSHMKSRHKDLVNVKEEQEIFC